MRSRPGSCGRSPSSTKLRQGHHTSCSEGMVRKTREVGFVRSWSELLTAGAARFRKEGDRDDVEAAEG